MPGAIPPLGLPPRRQQLPGGQAEVAAEVAVSVSVSPAGRGGAAGPGRGAGGQKGRWGRIAAVWGRRGGRGEPPLLRLPCDSGPR